MLVIRLTKVGAKKRPYFRVVVTEPSAARDGAAVEILGSYDPKAQPERLEVNRERLAHWLRAGAQPSDTVRTLLARHKAPPVQEPAAEVPAGEQVAS